MMNVSAAAPVLLLLPLTRCCCLRCLLRHQRLAILHHLVGPRDELLFLPFFSSCCCRKLKTWAGMATATAAPVSEASIAGGGESGSGNEKYSFRIFGTRTIIIWSARRQKILLSFFLFSARNSISSTPTKGLSSLSLVEVTKVHSHSDLRMNVIGMGSRGTNNLMNLYLFTERAFQK